MIAWGKITITMILSFTVTSCATNRSVQQVCQLIASDQDACSHLPLCASGCSVNVFFRKEAPIPSLQLHQIER